MGKVHCARENGNSVVGTEPRGEFGIDAAPSSYIVDTIDFKTNIVVGQNSVYFVFVNIKNILVV